MATKVPIEDKDKSHLHHRERLRKRFLQEGLAHFTDEQVIELLLFYAIPRRDVMPIAKALLRHFGSIPTILRASQEELMQVEGVGPNAAALLRLLLPLSQRYMERERKPEQSRDLTEPGAAAAFLIPKCFGSQNEQVWLLCLDAEGRLLYHERIHVGTPNSVIFDVRKIVSTALRVGAAQVILGHNHPGGALKASPADLMSTRSLENALLTLQIQLWDHILVCGDRAISLRDAGGW